MKTIHHPFPSESRTDTAVTAAPPGRHSDSGTDPLRFPLSVRGLRWDHLLEVLIFLFLIGVFYVLLVAFADAATPTATIELPQWQFGKPHKIETTLFP